MILILANLKQLANKCEKEVDFCLKIYMHVQLKGLDVAPIYLMTTARGRRPASTPHFVDLKKLFCARARLRILRKTMVPRARLPTMKNAESVDFAKSTGREFCHIM